MLSRHRTGRRDVMLPDVCVPPETPTPDRVYEASETRTRVRRAIQTLPPRERKVIALYYFRDVTMKQIGAEIGVNESRVSQLHARAIQRLQKALGGGVATTSLAAFQAAKARQAERQAVETARRAARRARALPDRPRGRRAAAPTAGTAWAASGSRSRRGSARPRCPATSPVTKITRRASAGELLGDGPVERRAVEPRHLQVADDHVERARGDARRALPRRRRRG